MSFDITKVPAKGSELVQGEVTIRFLEPKEREIARCRQMAHYLTGVLQDDEHTEQKWLVRVDDEGMPIGRTRCYAGDDTDGMTYTRRLLLGMLSAKDGRFVVVHYGRGSDLTRDIGALVVHKAIAGIAALARIDLVDSIIAENIDDKVRFRSVLDR